MHGVPTRMYTYYIIYIHGNIYNIYYMNVLIPRVLYIYINICVYTSIISRFSRDIGGTVKTSAPAVVLPRAYNPELIEVGHRDEITPPAPAPV